MATLAGGQQSADILRAHQLRHTEPREAILSIFLGQGHALTYGAIEDQLSPEVDRVTVYRTLRTFVAKGILHTIPDEKDSVKYALCAHDCAPTAHQHNHVHFTCADCGQTTCLDQLTIPRISLPTGFSFGQANLIVQGTCNNCTATA
jgi:Fur family transcriptional regulator, ferric uptake regulator